MRVRALQSIKYGSKWRIPGQPSEIFEVPPEVAEKMGRAVEVLEASTPQAVEMEGLPGEIPARDLLLEAGLRTLDAIRGHDDLTQIKGIGKKTAEAIADFLGA